MNSKYHRNIYFAGLAILAAGLTLNVFFYALLLLGRKQ
jgi:hypothetical protein